MGEPPPNQGVDLVTGQGIIQHVGLSVEQQTTTFVFQ